MVQKRKNSLDQPPKIKKQEKSDVSTRYCVCRSTDGTRFMIACDKCQEWFHGDCIGVTSKQADQIYNYFCTQCRYDTSLEIVYKTPISNTNKSKPKYLISSKKDMPHKNAIVSRNVKPDSHFAGEIKSDPICSPDHSFSSVVYPPNNSNTDGWVDELQRSNGFNGVISDQAPVSRSNYNRSRSCGTCTGCSRAEDCGRCDHCLDRRKFGGPNRMRKKCRFRQCIDMSVNMRNKMHSSSTSSLRRKKQSFQYLYSNQSELDDEEFFSQFSTPMDLSGKFSSSQASNENKSFLKCKYDLASAGHAYESISPSALQFPADLQFEDHLNLFLDPDSDEDVILPDIARCAGPGCSAHLPRLERMCRACRVKFPNYTLPYPDHMYCRHHADWQPSDVDLTTPSHGQLDHHRVNGDSQRFVAVTPHKPSVEPSNQRNCEVPLSLFDQFRHIDDLVDFELPSPDALEFTGSAIDVVDLQQLIDPLETFTHLSTTSTSRFHRHQQSDTELTRRPDQPRPQSIDYYDDDRSRINGRQHPSFFQSASNAAPTSCRGNQSGDSQPITLLPHPDDFYSVDSDGLEINWPLEAVTGV